MRCVTFLIGLCAAQAACTFAPGGSANGDGGPRLDGPRTLDARPLDAPPGAPSCTDGIQNGTETGIDCGGSCSACQHLFTPDSDTLALFELDSDATDSSGNHNDATLIGGTFVTTSWGHGLAVGGDAAIPQGLDWSAHASLFTHPYTIEMVVTPKDTGCWKKLFGPDDALDLGWNYCVKFQTYPNNKVGSDLANNVRNYFAIVSTSASDIDVYVDGVFAGNIPASFAAPPTQAIFFRDDLSTGRTEQLQGVIDALRISKVARTAGEIAATQTKLATQP